jgi:hypothetical protein
MQLVKFKVGGGMAFNYFKTIIYFIFLYEKISLFALYKLYFSHIGG